ncbi:helix-turn-helix transcriptional regulator [Fulvivirgaceae bacterium PWU4]|uniref:Helix-turn-helix transcriptional regulator n=1 Tax=Chryseosolibacter histidini TaxID=2782349 RepID=A0AAP2GNQ2_9BACT|nr:helix-turn-helix transcriptional regulator [Chryseosolibacter histidini]
MDQLNRIQEVINKKGITAYRLHKDTGITYALISAYIKNLRQPTLETLKRISESLGVKGRDLINF